MGLLSAAAPIAEGLKLVNTLLSPLVNRGERRATPSATAVSRPRDFQAELRNSLRAAQAAAGRAIAEHDINSDGFLTNDEFGIDAKTFARIDANHDGKLDEHELIRAYRR